MLQWYSCCWFPIEAVLKPFFAGRDLQAELADQKVYLEQSEFTINITIRTISIEYILIVQYMQPYIYISVERRKRCGYLSLKIIIKVVKIKILRKNQKGEVKS